MRAMKSRNDKMGGQLSMHGRGEKYINILITKSEREKLFGRYKRRWKDNIKINVK
jgi:hypothetical protein